MDRQSHFQVGYLEVRSEGHVAQIVMQRPEKLNAMTAGFWSDLREALDRLASDGETRVAIITGGGDRAFSAGGDIAGFLHLQTIDEMRAYQVDAMQAFAHVEGSPLIVIAAVNGIAYGGGCELAMASDIVIASDAARFAMPEAMLGLVPGFGVLRAPDVVGRQMAKLLIATGENIDAQRALEVGLVQRVVPAAELMVEARRMAETIAARSPMALSVAKRMVNRTIDDAALNYSVEEITILHTSEDRKCGVEAFLAKRTPVFTGGVKVAPK
ncbi:MAG TPA: enoyl-CoA hydratase/isomerase family protein [Allosphingosinicella sp.]|jgi:enoyl-CoA hydratase